MRGSTVACSPAYTQPTLGARSPHAVAGSAVVLLAGILSRDFVSITSLLVLLAHKFSCPYQLPSDVTVVVIQREVRDGREAQCTAHCLTAERLK